MLVTVELLKEFMLKQENNWDSKAKIVQGENSASLRQHISRLNRRISSVDGDRRFLQYQCSGILADTGNLNELSNYYHFLNDET